MGARVDGIFSTPTRRVASCCSRHARIQQDLRSALAQQEKQRDEKQQELSDGSAALEKLRQTVTESNAAALTLAADAENAQREADAGRALQLPYFFADVRDNVTCWGV